MPLIQVFYAEGASLAEAFYQSVASPYQLLIAGAPLCQPWAKKFTVSLEGLKKDSVVKNKISLTPQVNQNSNIKVAIFDFFIDGCLVHRMKPGSIFEFDTKKIPDGFHELRLVGIAANSLQTQARIIVPFTVNNHGYDFTVKSSKPEIAYNAVCTISAASKNAREIRFLHNGRVVGKIAGAEGQVKIPGAKLGPGIITLYPMALIGENEANRIIGKPVTFKVTMPKKK